MTDLNRHPIVSLYRNIAEKINKNKTAKYARNMTTEQA